MCLCVHCWSSVHWRAAVVANIRVKTMTMNGRRAEFAHRKWRIIVAHMMHHCIRYTSYMHLFVVHFDHSCRLICVSLLFFFDVRGLCLCATQHMIGLCFSRIALFFVFIFFFIFCLRSSDKVAVASAIFSVWINSSFPSIVGMWILCFWICSFSLSVCVLLYGQNNGRSAFESMV